MKALFSGYEIIRDVDSFQLLRQEWDELFQNGHFNYPFLTFDWMMSWWKNFGQGKELFILKIRTEEGIAGIVPLMKTKKLFSKILEFIGTDRSDYLNLLISRKIEQTEFIRYIFKVLSDERKEWGVLNLRNLALSESEIISLKDNAEKQNLSFSRRIDTVCPYLSIQESWESYLNSKSPKHRKNIKRLGKAFTENYKLEVCNKNNKLPVDYILKEILDVESKSWKTDAGNPRIGGEKASRFFHDIFSEFISRDLLEAWLLSLNDKPVAYVVNFVCDSKIYFYNVAYDKNYAKYSPGTYLISLVLQDAFSRNIKEFDFLRGDELYKRFWTKTNRQLFQVEIHRKAFSSVLSAFVSVRLRWFLREYRFFQILHSKRIWLRYKLQQLFKYNGGR